MTLTGDAESGRQRALTALYSRVAPDYETTGPPWFEHAGRRLVVLTEVAAGHRVLDVATGRGAVLLPAAEKVGGSGSVLGIDIAPGMVSHTAAAIRSQGLHNARVRLLDADSLPADLPAHAFDRVLCSFAVFFLTHLEEVLHAVRALLRPAGVVGFAFSRGTDPRWTWYEQQLHDVGAFDGLPSLPGSPQIRQPGALVAALDAAGFRDAVEIVEPAELLHASPLAWWSSLWTHGSRLPLERLAERDPETLARIEAASVRRATELAQPTGVPELVTFVYVTATAPGE